MNHAAPDEFRQAYVDIVSDPATFHASGAYTATLGDWRCREQLAAFEAELFGIGTIDDDAAGNVRRSPTTWSGRW